MEQKTKFRNGFSHRSGHFTIVTLGLIDATFYCGQLILINRQSYSKKHSPLIDRCRKLGKGKEKRQNYFDWDSNPRPGKRGNWFDSIRRPLRNFVFLFWFQSGPRADFLFYFPNMVYIGQNDTSNSTLIDFCQWSMLFPKKRSETAEISKNFSPWRKSVKNRLENESFRSFRVHKRYICKFTQKLDSFLFVY